MHKQFKQSCLIDKEVKYDKERRRTQDMVDTNKLKAAITERGTTQKRMAELLGMSRRAWDYRIQNKNFNTNEAYILIKELEIDNPSAIFFAD